MKTLIAENPVSSHFQWVEGHSVEKKGIQNCTPPEIMNDIVDDLADREFFRSLAQNDFIKSEFPFERLRVRSYGTKITGNLRKELDNISGEYLARRHFQATGKICEEDFPKVWWDGMDYLMKGYPKMYRVWLTKHVSGCCGTNKMMSYWKPDWTAMCPSCGHVVETTEHITRCGEYSRRRMLSSSVDNLISWFYETTDDYDMAMSLSTLLMAQGSMSMREAVMETSGTQLREDEVEKVTSDTDKLGWDCMLEGRLSKEWLKYARKRLTANNSPTSPERWTRRLMDKLIQITHTNSGFAETTKCISKRKVDSRCRNMTTCLNE